VGLSDHLFRPGIRDLVRMESQGFEVIPAPRSESRKPRRKLGGRRRGRRRERRRRRG
jgi:hypothetical protein